MNDTRARILAALAAACIAGGYALARMLHEPAWPTDFDQLWFAARAWRDGGDPYLAIGPGRPFQWDWPLLYPFPAVLIAVPFSFLPVTLARVAFAAFGAGVLGAAMGRRAARLWPVLLSAAFLMSAARGQWSPLVLATLWVPALAALAVAKPTIAIASLAPWLPPAGARPRAAIAWLGSATLAGATALLTLPGWVGGWIDALPAATHVTAPVTTLPGVLLLLAGMRWKRPEARVLLVMACVPHTPSIYDLLPLFFACRTLRDALIMSTLSHLAFWANIQFGGGTTFDAYTTSLSRIVVIVMYLPCMAMILARPNMDDDPMPSSVVQPADAAPRTRVDQALVGLLGVLAFLFVYLPLVTTRQS